MSNENEEKTRDYTSFLPWQQQAPTTIEKEYTPDFHSGAVYLEDENLRLATEIAIVTNRPLLLRGEPGSGKSSFAPFVARNLNWKYYEFNVTGRTEAKDLLWRFDALRRLRDAQAREEKIDSKYYVTPSVLWWAFNFQEALKFVEDNKPSDVADIHKFVPFHELNSKRNEDGAVVLIDEIDKADPNVPNDLLEVIGINRFRVEETQTIVKRPKVLLKQSPDKPSDYGNLLIIITTNEERDLPPAFLRRCIIYNLSEPKDSEVLSERWTQIANLHLSKSIEKYPKGKDLVKILIEKCWELREQTASQVRRSPSVAEFLDALKTCLRLGISPDSEKWQQIEQSVLIKNKQ